MTQYNLVIFVFNLYNNKCFVVVRSAALELMRACDTSLEPPWLPYDQVMGTNRFARTARPPGAKECSYYYISDFKMTVLRLGPMLANKIDPWKNFPLRTVL